MKANSTIEQQQFNGLEKRDCCLILKMEFNYQISQWNIISFLLPVFFQIGFILSKKCHS